MDIKLTKKQVKTIQEYLDNIGAIKLLYDYNDKSLYGFRGSLGSNGGSANYRLITTRQLKNTFNIDYYNDKVLGGGGVRYTVDGNTGVISDIAYL